VEIGIGTEIGAVVGVMVEIEVGEKVEGL